MKYSLWTAYGDSKIFAGNKIGLKFQGPCQGSGADPTGWAVISITTLCAYKSKGHGGNFLRHISNLTEHLSSLLFVDDTYLIHINLKDEETPTVTHKAMKDSISIWGQLLIASEGEFKPPKSFYHLIYFC